MKWKSLSCVWLFVIPWTVENSPGTQLTLNTYLCWTSPFPCSLLLCSCDSSWFFSGACWTRLSLSAPRDPPLPWYSDTMIALLLFISISAFWMHHEFLKVKNWVLFLCVTWVENSEASHSHSNVCWMDGWINEKLKKPRHYRDLDINYKSMLWDFYKSASEYIWIWLFSATLLLALKRKKRKCYSLRRVWLFGFPWTVAHQAPLIYGISRQEYWDGSPFPSPGHLPNPGIKPVSPALQMDSLLYESPSTEVFKVWLGHSCRCTITF